MVQNEAYNSSVRKGHTNYPRLSKVDVYPPGVPI